VTVTIDPPPTGVRLRCLGTTRGYWTDESVYYKGHRDITWRLHVSGKVTQTYKLSAGAGWHSYKYNMNRKVPQSGSSVICVGASNTPGFPCEAVPVGY
jgi:hypothetical protein